MKIIEDNPEDLNKYLQQGTPTFLFFYLDGCQPCEQTTKEWVKMKDRLKNERGDGDEIIIARAESELIPKVEGKNGKKFEIEGFPSIHFISSSGEPSEFNGPDRSVDSLLSWVSENAPVQEGGKRKTRRRRTKSKRRHRKIKKTRRHRKK